MCCIARDGGWCSCTATEVDVRVTAPSEYAACCTPRPDSTPRGGYRVARAPATSVPASRMSTRGPGLPYIAPEPS